MRRSGINPVTINFLGVLVQAKFCLGKYDYSAKITFDLARECYCAALHRLASDSVPFNFNIQVSVGVTTVGKVYQVSLFRYVKNGSKEDVQCILNLRYSEFGKAEISVTHTTFGLMIEPDDSVDCSGKEVMLWSD
jgi:hypothetical protein